MTPTALIIEDDHASCFIYQQILEALGFKVNAIYDGAEAFDALKNARGLDLILLDMLLPHVNGSELFGYIIQADHLKNTAVVVISAHRRYRDVLELRPHDRFLLKPVAVTEVREAIHHALWSASNRS